MDQAYHHCIELRGGGTCFIQDFADEAGASIDTQIKATVELGWRNIECRNVDWVNLTDAARMKYLKMSARNWMPQA